MVLLTLFQMIERLWTVTYVKIEQGECDRLTKQLKSNEALEERVKELEKTVRELKELLIEEI